MKKIIGICILLFTCFQASAQLESEGEPMPFQLPAASYARTASSFFQVVKVDTTQALSTHNRNYVVGQVAAVDFNTDKDGTWQTTTDGTRLWRMGIVCPQAASVSVVLNHLNMPEGAKIFVYNPQQTHVLGAFGSENQNEQGILPIRPLLGDSLIVEYQEPAGCAFQGSFGIERVAHNRKTNSFNASNKCSPHALWMPELPLQKQAVCMLYVVSSVEAYYGSGCLINNTEGKPYIYTAAHTFISPDDATRTISYFNYAVAAQDSTIQGTQECTMAGGTARAWATGIDMALIELNQMPPKDYRPYLAGWTRTKKPQPPLICIQQPYGDSKKMSYDNHAPIVSNYPGTFEGKIKNGWWYISRWEKGVTESGSSGSPLFDKQGLIVGALSGGSSYCHSPISDYFARLDTAWAHYSDYSKQLAHWLSPKDNTLKQMPGVDPYQDETCLRLTHIQKGNSIQANRHSKGYYAGHNQAQHTAFAERFKTAQGGSLYGVYVIPYKGSYNKNAPVYITVYSGQDKPEKELGRVLLRPRDYTCDYQGKWGTATKVSWGKKENYMRFSTPIEVPPTFFVGVEIQYATLAIRDTLALYNTQTPTNQAYYFDGSTWNAYNKHHIEPANLSLWIEPVYTPHTDTGIAALPATQGVVYPNPTAKEVHWQCDEADAYKLYNMQGMCIAAGTENTVSIAQAGVYVLCLYQENQPLSVHKVIRY